MAKIERNHPKILLEQPKLGTEIQILSSQAVILFYGLFYHAILNAAGQVRDGLVPYDNIFKPTVVVLKVLPDHQLVPCISEREVLELCIPENWRMTAKQQTKLPDLILNSLERWKELHEDNDDTGSGEAE